MLMLGLGYQPMMHNRSGTLFEEEPGPFRSRIYEIMSIKEDMLIPLITPADKQNIRAVFQVGLLIGEWCNCLSVITTTSFLNNSMT